MSPLMSASERSMNPPMHVSWHHHEVVDSTNLEAKRIAALQPDRIHVVTAEVQTAGRGRLDRRWQSPSGGVWMTVAWPCARSLSAYQPVPLIAAVAVRRAIVRSIKMLTISPGRVQIKWPNDLLLDARKVAGILCEANYNAQSPTTLFVGIGVNADIDPADLQGELRYPPNSLRAVADEIIDVPQLARELGDAVITELATFESEGFSQPLQAELHERLAFLGLTVRMSVGDEVIVGQVLGIDECGGLTLKAPSGTRTITMGEIEGIGVADLDDSHTDNHHPDPPAERPETMGA